MKWLVSALTAILASTALADSTTQIVNFNGALTMDSGSYVLRHDFQINGFKPATGVLKAVTISIYAKTFGKAVRDNSFSAFPVNETVYLLHAGSVGFWDAGTFTFTEAAYAAGVSPHTVNIPAFSTGSVGFGKEIFDQDRTEMNPATSSLVNRFKSDNPITLRLIAQVREFPFLSGSYVVPNGSVKGVLKITYTYY